MSEPIYSASWTYGDSPLDMEACVGDSILVRYEEFLRAHLPHYRPPTWAERERAAVEYARLSNRLRRVWRAVCDLVWDVRYRLARRIYPYVIDVDEGD